jgi:hypothetical protein
MIVDKNVPEWLVNEITSYLYMNGMVMNNKDFTGVTHVPITIFPTHVSKTLFDKVDFYQIVFNKLIDKISRDQVFIEESLKT